MHTSTQSSFEEEEEAKRKQWQELQKQLRTSGRTNVAVLQTLGKLYREEEGVHNHEDFLRKQDPQRETVEKQSFWRRRFMRRSEEKEETDFNESDRDPNANVITRFAKQKYKPKKQAKLTFSENVQDMLLNITSQFEMQINAAFGSDPATKEEAQDPKGVALSLDHIDNNMKAIDEDMRILDAAKRRGEETCEKLLTGFGQLGEKDYLSTLDDNSDDDSDDSDDDSDDSSDDDSDDDDSGSEEDSDEDSDDDSSEEDSDESWETDDDSSIESYDDLMKEMQAEMGIVIPDRFEESDSMIGSVAEMSISRSSKMPSICPSRSSVASMSRSSGRRRRMALTSILGRPIARRASDLSVNSSSRGSRVRQRSSSGIQTVVGQITSIPTPAPELTPASSSHPEAQAKSTFPQTNTGKIPAQISTLASTSIPSAAVAAPVPALVHAPTVIQDASRIKEEPAHTKPAQSSLFRSRYGTAKQGRRPSTLERSGSQTKLHLEAPRSFGGMLNFLGSGGSNPPYRQKDDEFGSGFNLAELKGLGDESRRPEHTSSPHLDHPSNDESPEIKSRRRHTAPHKTEFAPQPEEQLQLESEPDIYFDAMTAGCGFAPVMFYASPSMSKPTRGFTTKRNSHHAPLRYESRLDESVQSDARKDDGLLVSFGEGRGADSDSGSDAGSIGKFEVSFSDLNSQQAARDSLGGLPPFQTIQRADKSGEALPSTPGQISSPIQTSLFSKFEQIEPEGNNEKKCIPDSPPRSETGKLRIDSPQHSIAPTEAESTASSDPASQPALRDDDSNDCTSTKCPSQRRHTGALGHFLDRRKFAANEVLGPRSVVSMGALSKSSSSSRRSRGRHGPTELFKRLAEMEASMHNVAKDSESEDDKGKEDCSTVSFMQSEKKSRKVGSTFPKVNFAEDDDTAARKKKKKLQRRKKKSDETSIDTRRRRKIRNSKLKQEQEFIDGLCFLNPHNGKAVRKTIKKIS